MPRLIVSHGDMVEQEVELTNSRITIGRHPDNDIVIAHRAVSGRHAVITVSVSDTEIEDLGSTNGTFVNGERIARHTLSDRDVITIALHTISYVAASAPVPAGAPTPVASVAVINGPNAGKKLTLVKALTTLGRPGVLVVVIGRHDGRYFMRKTGGAAIPLVNGAPMREGAQHFLADGDRIELAGIQMRFSTAP